MADAVSILSKTSFRVSVVAAALLAIPLVSFFAMVLIIPLLICLALAIVANLGPLALAGAWVLHRCGVGVRVRPLFEFWLNSSIIWVGAAYGLSRAGDVGSGMGATNEAYWKVLMWPYAPLFGLFAS